MPTLNIEISPDQFQGLQGLGLPQNNVSFDELKRLIFFLLLKEALKETQKEAQKTALKDLSLEEINAEINAVRRHD